MIMLISFLVVLIVNFLFGLMYYKNSLDGESVSSYECGFDFSSLTRIGFSYRFFLISILFLIFDVEIALMLPIPFLIVNEVGLMIVLLFVIILLVGLLYEYYCGVLDWVGNYVSKA